MNKFSNMIDRLAERYISTYIKADDKKVIAIEDVIRSYQGFSYGQQIPDSKLIEKITARFPGVKVDLERGVIHGLDWIAVMAPEPKKVIAFGIKLMQWRLSDMLHYNPLYITRGFTASEFAAWTKDSIASGGIISVYKKIAIWEALDFLDGEFSNCKKRGNMYHYKGEVNDL